MKAPTGASLEELRNSSELAFTVAKVARALGVDERTVSGAVQRGELPSVTLGRRVLIPREPFIALFTAAAPAADVSIEAAIEAAVNRAVERAIRALAREFLSQPD